MPSFNRHEGASRLTQIGGTTTTHGPSSVHRLLPIGALLIPAALAVASLAPVLVVSPMNELAAYAPRGWDAQVTEYWDPPRRYRDVMSPTRVDQETLAIAATGSVALVGAGFAGESWTFRTDLVELGPIRGGDITLSFTDSEADEPYLAPVEGLRVMVQRSSAVVPAAGRVLAAGTQPPYAEVRLSAGRHRLVITSSWDEAEVRLDGALVWSGNPGWSDFAGVYPILHLAAGEARFSVVPAIQVSFPAYAPADPAAFRAAFVDSALGAQDGDGSFSPNGQADAWTAIALVLEHRRTGEARIADALDRWAAERAGAVVEGRSWAGSGGDQSLRENVGEPGIPLALWAKDRGRGDWARVVVSMVDSAGFTGCGDDAVDWCRLGNLQPDGSVIRAGEPGASVLLANFQFAETAGFIAGADLPSRREWIRSLAQRTYPPLPCQVVETIGPNRRDVDARPWSAGARSGHSAVMFLLGLAYGERPDDPVWSEPEVKRFVTCGIRILRSQVAGPMGWGTDALDLDPAIGSQDVAASRLLIGVTGISLDRDRFDVAWDRLIDRGTLRVRATALQPAWLADYRTAVAATMLELASP